MRKRLAIVIAFAVVAAMVAAVATASPPVVLQKQAHSTRAFSGLPLCSGFTVSATFEVTRTLTT